MDIIAYRSKEDPHHLHISAVQSELSLSCDPVDTAIYIVDTDTHSDWPGPEVIKTFFMLKSAKHVMFHGNNLKLQTNANSFLLNIAEHEIFSAN